MKYTPRELAVRISEGGRRGAAHTAKVRRDKRARYVAGTMSDDDRTEYEMYVEQRREAGKRGGTTTAARRMDKKLGLVPGTTPIVIDRDRLEVNNG